MTPHPTTYRECQPNTPSTSRAAKSEIAGSDESADNPGFVDRPFDHPAPRSALAPQGLLGRGSSSAGHRAPCAMLVQVERSQELHLLGRESEPSLRILRVKYPLPACVRMRVMRPTVVVVGGEVFGRDLALVLDAASDVNAILIRAESWIDEGALTRWLGRSTEIANAHLI